MNRMWEWVSLPRCLDMNIYTQIPSPKVSRWTRCRGFRMPSAEDLGYTGAWTHLDLENLCLQSLSLKYNADANDLIPNPNKTWKSNRQTKSERIGVRWPWTHLFESALPVPSTTTMVGTHGFQGASREKERWGKVRVQKIRLGVVGWLWDPVASTMTYSAGALVGSHAVRKC